MARERKFDVIALGGSAFDMLAAVERFPKPDTKNKMLEYVQQGGGTAANFLVALARLGAKVAYMGKLGRNEPSRLVIDEFLREGIDISNVIMEEEAGPYIALIIADQSTGERTIFWTDEMVRALQADDISEEVIAASKILYLDDWNFCTAEGALRAATLAKAAGGIVLLDAENPQKKEYREVIKCADFLVVSEDYAIESSARGNVNDAGAFFLSEGVKAAVLTRGAKGCLVFTGDKRFCQRAFKVEVIDSTGCGDAFHGGFAYGLLKDWPIEVTVEFASAVAALNCRRVGARAALPALNEVKEFLRARGSSLQEKI